MTGAVRSHWRRRLEPIGPHGGTEWLGGYVCALCGVEADTSWQRADHDDVHDQAASVQRPGQLDLLAELEP